jgi:hypothetical protein
MKMLTQMLTISKMNLWRYHVKLATHAAFVKDPTSLSFLPVDEYGRRK